MKKSLLIAASLLLCTGNLMALPKSASAPRLLIKTSKSLMAPVWSPDGKKIAVTGDNYIGIWVANVDGSGMEQVSESLGAGYKMSWLDNATIISTPYTVVDNKRMTSIEQVNVETGKATTVATAKHEFKRSKASKRINNAYQVMVDDPTNACNVLPGLQKYAGRMVINPQVSPNGKLVAFQIVGKGAFVCDADGNNVISAGKGAYPSWMPNSEEIVFTVLQDDGHNFTGSEIRAFNVVNGTSTTIDVDDNKFIPVTISVSPNGDMIAFDNDKDGLVYVMDIK